MRSFSSEEKFRQRVFFKHCVMRPFKVDFRERERENKKENKRDRIREREKE
jgi:hypothetical protein